MPDQQESSIWIKDRERLAKIVHDCLSSNNPKEVNFSLFRHTIIAPVLRLYAYDKRCLGKTLPITFLDGSRPTPFPIGCLDFSLQKTDFATSPADKRVIKVGLMSFRHPEMDFLVDYYITQNRELAAEDSMADEEELTFKRTSKLLENMGDIELWVFHTGLEPMVVGFYRAVTERLRKDQSRLIVRPFFYLPRKGVNNTKPYTPDSAGAQLCSYFQADPWF